eukprot:gene27693-33447_t
MLTESEDHDGHDHDHSHESSVSHTPASGISAEEFMNLTRFGETTHLRHVLDKSPGLVDARGCTPLCICAQYNHTPLVVFLLHIHADGGVSDSAQDTPAHWAAYKGHAEVLEVLCACASGYLDKEDVYGQTPLHLACIKGHTYASTAKKDKGGLTPLDHAVQKGHAQLESVWLWRVIFVSNFYATYMTLYYMMYSYPTNSHTPDHSPDHSPDTHTTDHTPAAPPTTTHTPVAFASYTVTYLVCVYLVSLLVQAAWWVCFAGCLHTPPGFVEDGVSLCHTCQVRRPLRSKHCKVQD